MVQALLHAEDGPVQQSHSFDQMVASLKVSIPLAAGKSQHQLLYALSTGRVFNRLLEASVSEESEEGKDIVEEGKISQKALISVLNDVGIVIDKSRMSRYVKWADIVDEFEVNKLPYLAGQWTWSSVRKIMSHSVLRSALEKFRTDSPELFAHLQDVSEQ